LRVGETADAAQVQRLGGLLPGDAEFGGRGEELMPRAGPGLRGLAAEQGVTTDGIPWGFSLASIVDDSYGADGSTVDLAHGALADVSGDGRADLCAAYRRAAHRRFDGVRIGCAEAGAAIARRRQIAHQPDMISKSHEKSSVGCAAALATLDVIRDEELLERSRVLGAHGLERLRRIQAAHPAIRAVRGLGVSFGVEMADAAFAETLMYRCLANGLSFKVGGGSVVTLCPPLTITRTDLDVAFDILDLAIRSDARSK